MESCLYVISLMDSTESWGQEWFNLHKLLPTRKTIPLRLVNRVFSKVADFWNLQILPLPNNGSFVRIITKLRRISQSVLWQITCKKSSVSWKCWKINGSTTALLYTLQLLLTVWDCGCRTHGPQVLCKPGLFRASTPRELIACTANLLMLTIHAGRTLHVQMVLSCVPQFSRFLPHDSSNHVFGKYLIIF